MVISEVDAGGLDAMRSGGAQVVDVRSDAEAARGMIAGAKHIPLASLPGRLGELQRDRPVLVYCQVGARSTQAAQFLANEGFVQVVNLKGGLNAWLASGRSLGA
jgi:rhodanese-related sulfurtransferase